MKSHSQVQSVQTVHHVNIRWYGTYKRLRSSRRPLEINWACEFIQMIFVFKKAKWNLSGSGRSEPEELRRHKLIYLLIMKSAAAHLKCRRAAIGWSCWWELQQGNGDSVGWRGRGCISICCPPFVTRHSSWQLLRLCSLNWQDTICCWKSADVKELNISTNEHFFHPHELLVFI